MKQLLLFIVAVMTFGQYSFSQVLDLYGTESSIPNFRSCPNKETYKPNEYGKGIGVVSNITRPTVEVFLPKVPNPARSAVIICPGGGYSIVAIDHEGKDVAHALNEMSIAAFVLKYRIPDSSCMNDKQNVPLMDAQQAMLQVRENAVKYKIDTNKIGILGFSAGGHLASTASTHYTQSLIANPRNISLRPDFMILIYPVISFRDSITHMGSRLNLVGNNATEEAIHQFSNEEQVTANTPPSFLVHALDDNAVPSANSVHFVEALQKNKVAAELHLYQSGGHGFGMRNPTTKDEWMERLQNWLVSNKFLR